MITYTVTPRFTTHSVHIDITDLYTGVKINPELRDYFAYYIINKSTWLYLANYLPFIRNLEYKNYTSKEWYLNA